MYPWDHWRTLVPLCLGSAGLVGAIVYEKYVPVEPMIPLSIFNNRSAAVTYIGTVLHGMVVSLAFFSPFTGLLLLSAPVHI